MDNPGDYYRAKAERAEEIRKEIKAHEKECSGEYRCRKCLSLNWELELALYTGD